jgi:hypothetical protein
MDKVEIMSGQNIMKAKAQRFMEAKTGAFLRQPVVSCSSHLYLRESTPGTLQTEG